MEAVVAATGLVVREHGVGVGLPLGGIGGGDAVDDRLGLFVADFWRAWIVSFFRFLFQFPPSQLVMIGCQSRPSEAAGREGKRTLVVVDDVAEMVATAVVRLAHAHRVVRQVDVAVVACFFEAWVSMFFAISIVGVASRKSLQKTGCAC